MIDPSVTTTGPSRRPDGPRPGPPRRRPRRRGRARRPPACRTTGWRTSSRRPSRPRRPIGATSRGSSPPAWRGLKAAVRGDSSFFAHFYRGTLIAIAAAMLGVDLRGWCLLVLGACLVLLSELTHSAVDTLARAVGDPEEFRLKAAREIAAAGVLVAAVGAAAVTLIVLTTRLFDLLGWRL